MDIEQMFELIFAARNPSGPTFVSALIDLAMLARLAGREVALHHTTNQELGEWRRSESQGNAALAVSPCEGR